MLIDVVACRKFCHASLSEMRLYNNYNKFLRSTSHKGIFLFKFDFFFLIAVSFTIIILLYELFLILHITTFSLSKGELLRAVGGVVASSSLLGVPLGHNSSFLQGPAFAPPRIREAIWCGSTNSTTEEGKYSDNFKQAISV